MKDLVNDLLKTATEINKLEGKQTIATLTDKLNELVDKVNELAKNQPKARDRGPSSERQMTDEDARAVMIGEHKGLSHKEAAEKLGLSYGQVYSARNGYTFKAIYKEMMSANKEK